MKRTEIEKGSCLSVLVAELSKNGQALFEHGGGLFNLATLEVELSQALKRVGFP